MNHTETCGTRSFERRYASKAVSGRCRILCGGEQNSCGRPSFILEFFGDAHAANWLCVIKFRRGLFFARSYKRWVVLKHLDTEDISVKRAGRPYFICGVQSHYAFGQ